MKPKLTRSDGHALKAIVLLLTTAGCISTASYHTARPLAEGATEMGMALEVIGAEGEIVITQPRVNVRRGVSENVDIGFAADNFGTAYGRKPARARLRARRRLGQPDRDTHKGSAGFMKLRLAVMTALIMLLSGCTTVIWQHIAFSYPSERLGLEVSLGYSAPGLYDELLSIKFNRPFAGVTDGEIQLDLVNMYTTAVRAGQRGYSGFYDPQSRYKDSWFTVMIIRDDPVSRRWLLSDPRDVGSIRVEAKTALVMADQAIIYSLSRRGISGEPTWTHYEGLSTVSSLSELGEVNHPDGTTWKGVEAVLHTRSALTDPKASRMSRWFSFRYYTGQPDEEVLGQVDPWHPVELPGRLFARHDDAGVFILVFFNGSRFYARDGTYVNTWNAALIEDYERMFRELEFRRVQ